MGEIHLVLWYLSPIGNTAERTAKGQQMKGKEKQITVTLRTPRGTEWSLTAKESQLPTIKRNAREMGYRIVKVA
jgi:hypothetical protein